MTTSDAELGEPVNLLSSVRKETGMGQREMLFNRETEETDDLSQRCFKSFSAHGAHKLITKILQPTEHIYIFLLIGQKIGIILSHLHQLAIVVLAAVIF